MAAGTIKNIGKSYGFIDANGQDVFFHSHNLPYSINKLRNGDLVEFTEVPTTKCRKSSEARDVKLIKKAVPVHSNYFRSWREQATRHQRHCGLSPPAASRAVLEPEATPRTDC